MAEQCFLIGNLKERHTESGKNFKAGGESNKVVCENPDSLGRRGLIGSHTCIKLNIIMFTFSTYGAKLWAELDDVSHHKLQHREEDAGRRSM